MKQTNKLTFDGAELVPDHLFRDEGRHDCAWTWTRGGRRPSDSSSDTGPARHHQHQHYTHTAAARLCRGWIDVSSPRLPQANYRYPPWTRVDALRLIKLLCRPVSVREEKKEGSVRQGVG